MKLVTALVLLALLVLGAGFTGRAFTASSSVSASQVGSSTQSITTAAKAPALCRSNGVTATNLVVSASATVNGTAASDLIIGNRLTNNQTLNGGGGKDCIVAGTIPAGRTITMAPTTGSGSVCIKGLGAGTYTYGAGCAVRG